MKATSANRLKTVTEYNFYWISIFLFLFISFASDGTPTSGMFVIGSVLCGIMITVLFYFVSRYVKHRNHILVESLLLYLIAEALFFCFSGEVSLFGISYKLGLASDAIDADIRVYREKTQEFFSAANAIAAIIVFFRRKYIKI